MTLRVLGTENKNLRSDEEEGSEDCEELHCEMFKIEI